MAKNKSPSAVLGTNLVNCFCSAKSFGFIEETVSVLRDFAKIDPDCITVFAKLKNRETCFGWEEPLLELLKISMQA